MAGYDLAKSEVPACAFKRLLQQFSNKEMPERKHAFAFWPRNRFDSSFPILRPALP